MFTAGNILHATFNLGAIKKEKFAIVLYKDETNCILTTFTTSQERSTVFNPCHGKNPAEGEPKSYVFKADIIIGHKPNSESSFSFHKDTTVVPDYGYTDSPIECFVKNAENLKVVCSLNENEFIDLIYTLYNCKHTIRKYKKIFEKILTERCK